MAISSFKQPGRISCFAFYKGKNGGFPMVLLVVTKPKYTPRPAALTPLFGQLYTWPLKIMF